MAVSAITIQSQTIPVQCPPVAVPAGALVDPADCSTVPQSVGVQCRLRCIQTDDQDVVMSCSVNRQWSAPDVLRCINDTAILTGLYNRRCRSCNAGGPRTQGPQTQCIKYLSARSSDLFCNFLLFGKI